MIAEAGVNHDGSTERAHQLVDIAADAGADAVKFQTFQPDALVAAGAEMAEYQKANTGKTQTQAAMLSALTLPDEAYGALKAHAADRGILFMSTPFDAASADLLDELDVPAFKIASGELTNHGFLEHVARKGRTILLSTGMATLSEIADAVDVLRGAGVQDLVLLHCVTSYPVEPIDANLRAMQTMEREFAVPIGWSDHTLGTAISVAAVALGAVVVEKHFTIDSTLPGPDHRASLEPSELRRMVEEIRIVESALGDGRKAPNSKEIEIARVARRSLHFVRTLPVGHLIAPTDLVALRPGDGCPPSRISSVVGRRLAVEARAGHMLREHDLE